MWEQAFDDHPGLQDELSGAGVHLSGAGSARVQDFYAVSVQLGLRAGGIEPVVDPISPMLHTLLQKHVDRFDMKLIIVAEADSLSLAREALRAGAGFFVAPFSALDREIKAKEFVGAPIKGLEVTRGLFRHRDRPLARAAITLSQLIETEIELLGATLPQTFRSISKRQLKG